MNKLIKAIEKLKPYFDAIARNRYLKAIKDGFISAMPIVLFSSIFMLLAYVPNIFGFYWSKTVEAFLLKPYNYSMGILGLVVAGTTCYHLTKSLNRDMPVDNQINAISTMMCSMIGFMVVAVDSIISSLLREILQLKCQMQCHQIFHRHLKMLFHLEYVYCY